MHSNHLHDCVKNGSSHGLIITWMKWVTYELMAKHNYKPSASLEDFTLCLIIISVFFSVGVIVGLRDLCTHSPGSPEPWQMFSLW